MMEWIGQCPNVLFVISGVIVVLIAMAADYIKSKRRKWGENE